MGLLLNHQILVAAVVSAEEVEPVKERREEDISSSILMEI